MQSESITPFIYITSLPQKPTIVQWSGQAHFVNATHTDEWEALLEEAQMSS